jgi:hypothetical protein
MNFEEYFAHKDLRKTPKVGVHYEQKTTPDLLWCVSLVILDVTKNNAGRVFSDRDVRNSKVFIDLMRDYFSKPPQVTAEGEYNKVSRYQLELLAFAGVLEKVKTRPTKYKIRDLEALKYIAANDLSASKFLIAYTEKLLRDNGLWPPFERYINKPSQQNYHDAKEAYWEWAKRNTDIRSADPTHTYRVFNKMFNVIAYKYGVPGQHRSRVTQGPCPYSFLIYNRENFRDLSMPSGMSRQEYQMTLAEIDRSGVVATQLYRAKDSIKQKYSDSEIKEPEYGYSPGRTIMIHHILPQSVYREYSLMRENLIALTPDQHHSFAHNRGTSSINKHFQAVCLLKKLDHIIKSVNAGEDFYSYASFIVLINRVYDLDLAENEDPDLVREMLEQKIESMKP